MAAVRRALQRYRTAEALLAASGTRCLGAAPHLASAGGVRWLSGVPGLEVRAAAMQRCRAALHS